MYSNTLGQSYEQYCYSFVMSDLLFHSQEYEISNKKNNNFAEFSITFSKRLR